MRLRLTSPATALVALVLAPAASACPGADSRPTPSTLDRAERATVCLFNEQRADAGLARLREDDALMSAAAGHARDMVRRRFFSHVAPDGSSLDDRARAAGYGAFRALGETIAWGEGRHATPAATVRAWMRSSGHRAAIMEPDFRDVGVGASMGSPDGDGDATTFAADFARRGCRRGC